MEVNISTLKKEINKFKGEKGNGYIHLPFEDAVVEIQTRVKDFMTNNPIENRVVATKEDYRNYISKYRNIITDLYYEKPFKVQGYEDKMMAFIELMVNRIAGFDILSEAFEDARVSDIHGVSWDCIFVEKDGVEELYPYKFDNEGHYVTFIERINGLAKKEINKAENKILDYELFGSRFSIVSKDVAKKGIAFSIRNHPENHTKRDDLIANDVMSKEMGELIDLIIRGQLNTIIAGITGSGKTTTMRALLNHSIRGLRTLVAEDTRELFLSNPHTIDLLSIKNPDEKMAISLLEIIYATLRLKPKYIVIGEVRGEEATSAMEGAETGHSTHLSMHGGTTWNVLNRLITKYMIRMSSLGINVVERIIGSAVDYVFVQDNIPGVGRKITFLDEISYNYDLKKIVIRPIFEYNFKENKFDFKNKISKDKAINMMRRGVPYCEIEKWIEE